MTQENNQTSYPPSQPHPSPPNETPSPPPPPPPPPPIILTHEGIVIPDETSPHPPTEDE